LRTESYLCRMRYLLIPVLLLTLAAPARAQTDGVLEIGGELEQFLLRQQTAGRLNNAVLSNRPLSASEARTILQSLQTDDPIDQRLRDQFLGIAPHPSAEWAQSIWPAAFTKSSIMC